MLSQSPLCRDLSMTMRSSLAEMKVLGLMRSQDGQDLFHGIVMGKKGKRLA